jgi:hypothetical protein
VSHFRVCFGPAWTLRFFAFFAIFATKTLSHPIVAFLVPALAWH